MKFDIKVKNASQIAEALEIILASEYISSLKIKNYHWNVVSKRFMGNHAYFEEQYNSANDRIDEIAERIRTLGFFVKATAKDYLNLSKISEENESNLADVEMLKRVGNDKVVILGLLKDAIELASENGDIGTESLLSGFVESYEKDLWMLNSMDL